MEAVPLPESCVRSPLGDPFGPVCPLSPSSFTINLITVVSVHIILNAFCAWDVPDPAGMKEWKTECCFFFFFNMDHFKSFMNFLHYCLSLVFWFFGHEACGILATQPRTDPTPPCIGRQSLNYWTAKEVPTGCFLIACLIGV